MYHHNAQALYFSTKVLVHNDLTENTPPCAVVTSYQACSNCCLEFDACFASPTKVKTPHKVTFLLW